MTCSVEISMYPLTNAYGTPIIKFIEKLRDYPELQVVPNAMSTQVFGEYDALMNILQKEMKMVFEGKQEVVMVFKMANF